MSNRCDGASRLIHTSLEIDALNPLMVNMSSITITMTFRDAWAQALLDLAGAAHLRPADYLAFRLERILEVDRLVSQSKTLGD